jgi:hypothetical protein
MPLRMTYPRRPEATMKRVTYLVAIMLAGCGNVPTQPQSVSRTHLAPTRDTLSVLWETYVGSQLAGAPWTAGEAYDAGHQLMVPVHAAFVLHRGDWQHQFSDMLGRALREGLRQAPTNVETIRSRLMFLHVASRFVVLAQQTDPSLIPDGLVDEMYRQLDTLWYRGGPAKVEQLAGQGIRDHLLRVLARQARKQSPIPVGDYERMLIAIAGDLRHVERLSGQRARLASTVDDILALGLRVHRELITMLPQGGWVFQAGARSALPEYAYAGQPAIVAGMPEKRVPDIAEDASHSHRTPVWVMSLAGAYAPGTPERDYYEKLAHGLSDQFFRSVLVHPTPDQPFYRVTNFMDGRNGIYRQEAKDGWRMYGPYQLSGSLDLGWWAFLPSPCTVPVFRDMAASFPRSTGALETYNGGRYNPQARANFHRDGHAELEMRLAAEIARADQESWPEITGRAPTTKPKPCAFEQTR